MRFRSFGRRAFARLFDHSLLLIIGAAGALVWANLAPDTYTRVVDAGHFAANDIGMVFFFALAAKEVREATLPGGPLGSPRTAGMPLLAATGGMLGPACLFLTMVALWGPPALGRGWAIPCATDIAFSALAARTIFGPKHPAVPFLLMLAIADDALGLIILAVFYPSGALHLGEAALWMGAALGAAEVLRREKVSSFWPYLLVPGVLSWIALYRGGLHPALALVPIIPFMPHSATDLGVLDPRKEFLPDTLNRFEHWWKKPVEVILLGFGLVNAGVPLAGVGRGSWIVLGAMVGGKPLGIGVATLVGRTLSFELTGITWRDVVVLGMVAGIGFTVALFFATAAFAEGLLLEQTKMGALLSFAAALAAAGLAWGLRVGRFAPSNE